MATYTFHVADFSLTTTWDYTNYGGSTGVVGHNIIPASTTKIVSITGIALAENESIKRVMLTADLNRVGTTDYSEKITVNDLNFANESCKLNNSSIVPDSDLSLEFYYCASGKKGATPGIGVTVNYSCTLYFSNVTLTVTTGTGGSFDGMVESLPNGAKVLIDEADGVKGTYSVVMHGYNTGLCLLWRDNCVDETIAFNQNADTFLSTNYGKLDEYLNTTFYNSLPDTTKPFIQLAAYPTLDKRLYGTVTDIERYVCTPSVRELRENTGAAEGTVFDYLDTVDCDEVYWTRSVYTEESGKAWYISDSDGSAYTRNRDYASGVRPCLCVLESQLVTPSGDYYVLATQCGAPNDIRFATEHAMDDLGNITNVIWEAIDLTNQQQDHEVVIANNFGVAGQNAPISGYALWRCNTIDGEYELLEETYMDNLPETTDDEFIHTYTIVCSPPDAYMTYYYKVQTLAPLGMDYLNSPLSDACRLIATKRTNVKYYNGTKWLLVEPKYYNGNTWKISEGAKYYDGTQWLVSN